jgi:type I restriction enzyme M protein
MKFGKIFLKKDLSQYYTPLPIVTFISKILDVKPNQYVIDPAGGSADFLVGVLEKYKENVDKYRDQLFYWDASEDACKVAYMNMVLHGDGRSKIIEKDSIEEHEEMNKKFDFVITNPPFGNSTVWNKDKKILENYSLSKFTKELGVLFLERSINLLKEDGILVIILPSGYLNNQTRTYLRDYLLNYRIIADISLPEGAFKGANTGVKTDILIIKKSSPHNDYKIFVSSPKKLGFNYKSKKLEELFKVDKNGEYLLNNENEKILDNELDEVVKKFKKFCCEEDLDGLERCKIEKCNCQVNSYDYLMLTELKKDKDRKLKPELYLNSFREHMSELAINNSVTLQELSNRGIKISVENRRSIEIESSLEYYLSTSAMFHAEIIRSIIWKKVEKWKISIKQDNQY